MPDDGTLPPRATVIRDFDMGMAEAEFFRLLPAAAETFVVRDGIIEHRGSDRGWRIRLGPSAQLAIGRLQLPTLAVRFEFDGYAALDVERFMEPFFRYFRRGGG